ncbi:MAG: hypothetical protein HOW73_13535 [Polyangiaceae bacterium]|nr:hypothetical protein [Polyangiaceae bacterium]
MRRVCFLVLVLAAACGDDGSGGGGNGGSENGGNGSGEGGSTAPDCMTVCTEKAVECGAPSQEAAAEQCDDMICSKSPSSAQLSCVESSGCQALMDPAAACGIGEGGSDSSGGGGGGSGECLEVMETGCDAEGAECCVGLSCESETGECCIPNLSTCVNDLECCGNATCQEDLGNPGTTICRL